MEAEDKRGGPVPLQQAIADALQKALEIAKLVEEKRARRAAIREALEVKHDE